MYLVDTSVWVHALRPEGQPGIKARLRPLIIAGEIAVTEWILLELMTGLRKSESQETLLGWFRPIRRLTFALNSEWERAWSNAARLRQRGISATAGDCLIATVALDHKVSLVHCDADFEKMKPVLPLTTEDWPPHARR